MIKDLRIDGYRLFHHFELQPITGVNLIVGDNNSGKSSLLEAVYLLTSSDARSSLTYILNERGEKIVSGSFIPQFNRVQSSEGYRVAQIFHNRVFKSGQKITMQTSSDEKMSLQIVLEKATSPNGNSGEQPVLFDVESDLEDHIKSVAFKRAAPNADRSERLPLTEDGILPGRPYRGFVARPEDRSRFLTTSYMGYDELAVLWDSITLTPKEDKVVEALQILEPNVERISFTSSQTSNSGILLKIKGEDEPVPLGSMGDGMRRILAVVASLVSVDAGVLLVDEIDTGLYFQTLQDMWWLVLETAFKQKAQVFATTHSWDCVRAFQQALNNFSDPEFGSLIRLEKFGDQIKAVSYTADELDIAVNQGIEVR